MSTLLFCEACTAVARARRSHFPGTICPRSGRTVSAASVGAKSGALWGQPPALVDDVVDAEVVHGIGVDGFPIVVADWDQDREPHISSGSEGYYDPTDDFGMQETVWGGLRRVDVLWDPRTDTAYHRSGWVQQSTGTSLRCDHEPTGVAVTYTATTTHVASTDPVDVYGFEAHSLSVTMTSAVLSRDYDDTTRGDISATFTSRRDRHVAQMFTAIDQHVGYDGPPDGTTFDYLRERMVDVFAVNLSAPHLAWLDYHTNARRWAAHTKRQQLASGGRMTNRTGFLLDEWGRPPAMSLTGRGQAVRPWTLSAPVVSGDAEATPF